MPSSDSQSPPPNRAPHVRLNSSQANLLTNEDNNNRPLATQSQGSASASARPLVPPSRPPTAPSIANNRGVNKIYSSLPADSSYTLLVPPTSRSRTHRFRDEESVPGSPVDVQSRRTSISSDGRGVDTKLIGVDPFADSRAPSRSGSDDENVNTQTVSDKYNFMPSAGLLLFPEDIEKDDWLHNPDPNDKDDRECNIFNRRGMVNVGGLACVTLGLLVLFIGYPVL